MVIPKTNDYFLSKNGLLFKIHSVTPKRPDCSYVTVENLISKEISLFIIFTNQNDNHAYISKYLGQLTEEQAKVAQVLYTKVIK